jgi:hypothetical protein
MVLMIAIMLALGVPPGLQLDASSVTLSPPTVIVELDTGKLKGDLARLAWSPDAQQIYVQTVERDRAGSRMRHYVLGLDNQPPRGVDSEPAWAGAYWFWKSGRAAPGLPTFMIDVEQRQKRLTATATPMGGDLARGAPEGASATGMSGGGQAAYQSQMTDTFILKLKGEVIGEFVNAPAVPGLTFGWGPSGTGLIAFANRDGLLVIMDSQGRKQEVASSKAVLLPAWTEDGKQLAYLEKTGKKKFVLKVVLVTRPSS